jgi:hypothetical protein
MAWQGDALPLSYSRFEPVVSNDSSRVVKRTTIQAALRCDKAPTLENE